MSFEKGPKSEINRKEIGSNNKKKVHRNRNNFLGGMTFVICRVHGFKSLKLKNFKLVYRLFPSLSLALLLAIHNWERSAKIPDVMSPHPV